MLKGLKKALICTVFTLGIFVPAVVQVLLTLQSHSIKEQVVEDAQRSAYDNLVEKQKQVKVMGVHLAELNAIKMKTLTYLQTLDDKRTALAKDISRLTDKKSTAEKNLKRTVKELSKPEVSSNQHQDEVVIVSEKIVKNVMHVGMPINSQALFAPSQVYVKKNQCDMARCFDYNKCSCLDSTFRLQLVQPLYTEGLFSTLKAEFKTELINPCLVLVFVIVDEKNEEEINGYLGSVLKNEGQNHVLMLKPKTKDYDTYCSTVNKIGSKKSIKLLASNCDSFNENYDYIIPHVSEDVKSFTTILPFARKHFLTAFVQCIESKHLEVIEKVFKIPTDLYVIKACEELKSCKNKQCSVADLPSAQDVFKNSQFILITSLNKRYYVEELWFALRFGAIPIFLGNTNELPLNSVIDWKKVVLVLPYARLPEALFIAKSMHVNDFSAMKIQGRFIFKTYFSSQLSVLKTTIEAFKQRISSLPNLAKEYFPQIILNFTLSLRKEISTHYLHKFTNMGAFSHRNWNKYPGALQTYPVSPWSRPPPSLHQFISEGADQYAPIGDGKGGDGISFSRSLGGDAPFEMFTIVMLTYDRQTILAEALQRLSGIKYLHKLIVVWNHPDDPPEDLAWPEVGVPVQVVRGDGNSLNNRFIPYAQIETEAVLSMDDDIYLRHDEIELAFRVWRENRDRLVGFPGRHHSYNTETGSFDYNPEYSCELSLVLTGGAFFHKYYTYVYTYDMDVSIRKLVDTYMNCEDIAMNFLVAHITQKPPIKVTSRWTFRCPGCPAALSSDGDHYTERNKCMRFFEDAYGYNPLHRTQFRADSILFKTRIPQGLTKCFQYV